MINSKEYWSQQVEAERGKRTGQRHHHNPKNNQDK